MQVWNIAEAAKFLRISACTLRELVRAGVVPGAKVGGEWRFTDESLEDYMRELISPKKPAPKVNQSDRRRRASPPSLTGASA